MGNLAILIKTAIKKPLFAAIPERLLRRWIRRRLPRVINLEVTTACNLRCPLCPTHIVPRGQRFLDAGHIDKLLDQNDAVKVVCLHVQGEPLVHPDLFPMIRNLSDRGVDTHVGTNGMLIEQHLDALLTSGLTSLSVAIDGADAETYSRYRKRGDFEQVTRGTAGLLAERKRRGQHLPRVQLQSIMFSYNEDREAELTDFLTNFGADAIALKEPSYYNDFEPWKAPDSKVDPGRLSELEASSEQFLEGVDPEHAWSRSQDNQLKREYRAMPMCPQLEKGTVLSDGRVVACCMDADGSTTFGNLGQNTFAEIWDSAAHEEVLQQFQNQTLNVCQTCTLRA